jgi:UDP-N-acetyl-2-amino-2-deoxyglucuronate dehydrogenase
VHGERGSAVIEREEVSYFHAADGEQPGDAPDHNQAVALGGAAGAESIDDAHRDQYADFVDAVEQNRPPLIGTRDGRRALELVLGVYESARTGHAVKLGEQS